MLRSCPRVCYAASDSREASRGTSGLSAVLRLLVRQQFREPRDVVGNPPSFILGQLTKFRARTSERTKFEQTNNGERRTTQVPQLDTAEQTAEQFQASLFRVALATRGNPGPTDGT